jgi:hypothetical protein
VLKGRRRGWPLSRLTRKHYTSATNEASRANRP